MKVIRIEIPERLSEEINALVQAGWFTSETEIAYLALTDFVRRHRVELLERFQRDDIAWALQQREAGA